MKSKVISAILLMFILVSSTTTRVYASYVDATERGKALIGFAEEKDFSEEDYMHLVDGTKDKTAVRLMGVFVSNWIEPGKSLAIRDLTALAEYITEVIVENMRLPEEIATVYASEIAKNMIYGAKNLDIHQVEIEPVYYLDSSSATAKTLEENGWSNWLYSDGKIYGYAIRNSGGYYFSGKEEGLTFKSFSYYDAVHLTDRRSTYLITDSNTKANKGVVSLNDILFGSDYGYSGEMKHFWDNSASGSFRNDARRIGRSERDAKGDFIVNLDKDNFYIQKAAGIQLRIAQGETAGSIVWDNMKTSCRMSGSLVRNIIVSTERNRSVLLGTDKNNASGNRNVFASASSKRIVDSVGLMIDPFGNILAAKAGSNSGYMVIPACMNPYTFDSSGDKTILSNNFAMGYLYPTETGMDYERNMFQRQLNHTFLAIKREEYNGLYKASFVTAIRSLHDNTHKMFRGVTNDFSINSSDYGGLYVEDGKMFQAFLDTGLSLLDIKKTLGQYQFSMPVGLISWAKFEKPTGNIIHSKGSELKKIWNNNTATIDLVRYGGSWLEEGMWGSLITTDEELDENGILRVSSTICNDIVKSTTKYGKSKFKTAGSSYVYGLYVLYAHILTGETITVKEVSTRLNSITEEEDIIEETILIETASWAASKGFPELELGSEFAQKLQEIIFGTVSEKQVEEMKINVLSIVQKILSPKEALGLVSTLINQRGKEIVTGWHYDLLGLTSSTEKTVLMGDIGFAQDSAYITVPEMTEISWIDSVMQNFNLYLAIALIIITAIIVIYILIGLKTVQRGIFSVVLFGVCLFLVPVVLSYSISVSNSVSNKLIKNKFQYWVITQQQTVIEDLNSAYVRGDVLAYLQNANAELIAFANNSSATTSLRWQTPKKDDYIGQILGDLSVLSSTSSLAQNKSIMSTMRYLGNTTLSGQKFVDKNAGYLLRSYTDISMYAKIMYQELSKRIMDIEDGSGIDLQMYYDILDSYNRVPKRDENGNIQEGVVRRAGYLSSYDIQDNMLSNPGSSLTRYKLLSATSTLFNILDTEIKPLDIDSSNYDSVKYGLEIEFRNEKFRINTIKDLTTEELGIFQFLLYTESPLYYMFNSMADSGTMNDGNATGFRTVVLGRNFILDEDRLNDEGKNPTRDYIDFETFFKYTLPLMRCANGVVLDYDELYGLNLYGTIIDGERDIENLANSSVHSSEIDKAWHNKTVKNIWNLYSPWVDLMSECKYAQPEVITTMMNGRLANVTVQDPLNPASYKEMKLINGVWQGREMVFGESDMLAHGLRYEQLTTVEKKVYNILEDSKEDIYLLLNYHDYDNQVLTTAAAMAVLFNFNREFSESNLIEQDKVLYPQGYELKNFSFDAYLRTALMNATGLELTGYGNSGVYATIINSSNMFVGILMCAVDITGVYFIGNLKILFTSLLFLLGIVSILFSITVEDSKLVDTFKNSVLVPNLQFLAITVGHSIIASMLMGINKLEVIQSGSSMQNFKNPSTVLIALLILHCVVVYFYIKVCIGMCVKLYRLSLETINSVGGAIATLGSNITSAISTDKNGNPTTAGKAIGAISGVLGGAVSVGTGVIRSIENTASNRRTRGSIKRNIKKLNNKNEKRASENYSRFNKAIEKGKHKAQPSTANRPKTRTERGFSVIHKRKRGTSKKTLIRSINKKNKASRKIVSKNNNKTNRR